MSYNVNVLLSTYNGEKYLEEQLQSIIGQHNISLSLFVRDDGSKDQTINILESYKKSGLLSWYTGENMRPAKSFWNLLCNTPESDYYAFCDQDDVWMEDKMEVAINRMKGYENTPCLYFSAKRLVDKNLNFIADTNNHYKLTLGEAMINNPVTGCTMVINNALYKVLLSANPDFPSLHDAWIYRVCLSVGGKVIYDTTPHIMYRQHEDNVVGYVGLCGRFKALLKTLTTKKTSSARSYSAKELLRCYSNIMTDDSRNLLIKLSEYDKSLLCKVKLLLDNDMKTSSKIARLTFFLYVMFNKY